MRALIVVDVQNDFCPGGSLATANGDTVAAEISSYVRLTAVDKNRYAAIVATADWHIDPGTHFDAEPDFVDTWPVHCVAESHGAQFHPDIDPSKFQAVFRKGQYEAAYSGFEGSCNDVGLDEWLKSHSITDVDIVGIATDYCVRATALDALKAGYNVRVLSGMCSPVDAERGKAALTELAKAGAVIN